MVSITCVIEKTGKKFHNSAFVVSFLHANRKISCVGFIMRLPFREIATSRVINFTFDQTIVASDNCLSFACLLLFPTGTQYPAGTPFNDFRVPEKTQKVAKFRRF